MARGGPRKFFPRRLTTSQRAAGEALIRKAEERWNAAAPRLQEYLAFCQANDMRPENFRENLPFFIAQQKSDGLGWRTIRQYVRIIRTFRGVAHSYTVKGLLDVCDLETIGTPRRHAEDFDEATLLYVLQKLFALNTWAGVVGTLMLYLGLRYCDLSYIEPVSVDIRTRWIRIDVTKSKQIRHELLRTDLVIPDRLKPSQMFDEFLDQALAWIRTVRTPTLAPAGTVQPFNDLLKEVWAGQRGRAPTSYTFRRAAFRRFIADCTGPDGLVNWSKVCTFSLHMNEKMVKAFYHLKVSETLRTLE